jgi:AraC-like DNA-binding protein
MPFRFASYQSARIFFIINMDLLLRRWKNQDISYIELYNVDGSVLAAQGESSKGRRYLIDYNDLSGYRVNAYIPVSIIRRKMQGTLIFICISIGFFLFTGLGLSVYLSYRNTKPLKDGIFERILNGLIYTPKEWEDIADLFKTIPPVYCLCLIRGNDAVASKQSSAYSAVQEMMVFITEHINFSKHIDFTGFIHYIGVDQAVAPLPVCEAYTQPAAYQGILEKGIEEVETKNRVRLHIAVSGVFQGMEQLSDAYRQVRHILRTVTIHTPGAVFLEDASGKSLDRFPLEFTDSQRFYDLLLAADFEHASLMVHRAFAAINEIGCPAEPVIYHLFWSFEQVFIRIKSEHIFTEGEGYMPPEYSSIDTIEGMTEKIVNSAEQICGRIDRANKQKEAALVSSLMAYIDRNLADPMLCLAATAPEFALSERSAGNMVKKFSGKSFFEYVDQKRMKKAYALLSESDMPVNDVALKCGFALTNSFYKSFKRHFGFAPTSLRQNPGP